MALIKLTKGKVTEVDDELYINLNYHKWYAQGPDFRPARRVTYPWYSIQFMYHEILNVWGPDLRAENLVVDHIDGNVLNNRIDNLRIVSQKENMLNTARAKNRRGIGRDNKHNTWKVYLDQINGSRVNIGTCKTYEEAINMLAAAKIKYGVAQ